MLIEDTKEMVYLQHKQMRQNKHISNSLSNQYVNKLQLRTGDETSDPEHWAAHRFTAAHGERRESLEETPSHHLLVGNPMKFVIVKKPVGKGSDRTQPPAQLQHATDVLKIFFSRGRSEPPLNP